MTSKAGGARQVHFHLVFPSRAIPAGAWMSYGLGSENANLPAYVVLRSGEATDPNQRRGIYTSGFLPAQAWPSLTIDNDPAFQNLKPSEPAGCSWRGSPCVLSTETFS